VNEGGLLMQQIHITNNEAPKIGGVGTLQYQLWVDDGGSLYVQITKNSDGGTFPRCRFPVVKYALGRNSNDLGSLVGVELNGKEQKVGDNDGDGFLRAVLRHLLGGGDAA
jgi:hypothetical protein